MQQNPRADDAQRAKQNPRSWQYVRAAVTRWPIDDDGYVQISDHTRIVADEFAAQLHAKGLIVTRTVHYIEVTVDVQFIDGNITTVYPDKM